MAASAPPPDPIDGPHISRPRRKRWLAWLAVAAGIVLAAGLAVRAVEPWPDWLRFPNPFAAQETDRSGPVVLRSIQDLSRYVAAEGTYQVVIDLERSRAFVPDFLLNERVLFVAVGTVEGYVEFGDLSADAIEISQDGTAATVRLPDARLGEPDLDLDTSYVYAEQRGLLNRVGDVFGDDPDRQRAVYQRGEAAIAAAAGDSGLVERTRENTRSMLVQLLEALGFQDVTVEFDRLAPSR